MLDIVVKSCKYDTDWTVPGSIKIGTRTTYIFLYDKRTNPIDFQGFQAVKGQGHKLHIVVKPTHDNRRNPIDFQSHG